MRRKRTVSDCSVQELCVGWEVALMGCDGTRFPFHPEPVSIFKLLLERLGLMVIP